MQQIVTVALIVILFDGGMHIGWRRFRANAGAITWLGVVGTLVTAGALALVGHLVFGLPWRDALLVGTALAPTDPAVVFSVLGGQQVEGRGGVLLEGESGANDPAGIALMAAILAVGTASGGVARARSATVSWSSWSSSWSGRPSAGSVAGPCSGPSAGSRCPPRASTRCSSWPAPACSSAPTTVVHGSGYLAVFVAGIVLGDERAPYKIDIERFQSALASLGEIIAFTVLGLTVHLSTLGDGQAWRSASGSPWSSPCWCGRCSSGW